MLLFLAWRFPEAEVTGIEAQAISYGLAERSLAWNGLSGRCAVRHGDLREAEVRQGLSGAELVTGTPPYLPVGSGPESRRVQCGPCRFEHRGRIGGAALAAGRSWRRGVRGRCAAGFQRGRVEMAAAGAGLCLSAWMDVFPKPGKPPLFGVFSMQREGVPAVREETALYLRGPNDRFTVEHDLVRHALGIPVAA
ncbi:MAG: hypothetical protein R3F14_28990 [Polyangiaceae bacterium]